MNGQPTRTAATKQLEARFYRLMMLDRYLWRGKHSESPRFSRKQAIVDEMHRELGLDRAREPEPIAEIDISELTLERFREVSDNLRRIVVVRGFGRDMRAVNTWTPEFLVGKLGEAPCNALKYEHETVTEGWDKGAEVVTLPFREYIERMADERLYLNNSTDIITSCPELIDDLELDRIREMFTDSAGGWDELVTTNFFISSNTVLTSVHHAPGGNFFLQLAGRKRWTVIDPAYTAFVHPVNGRPFQYCNSAYGGFRAAELRGEGPDHPLACIPRQQATLEPGDLLYNAPWWWHEVENLDVFNVGCAVRHVPRPFRRAPSWSNHRLFTATSLYPALRAATYAHYLRYRLTGDTTPFREVLNRLIIGLLHRSLKANKARNG
ncbi:MAG: hypothetical protein ACI8PZ_002344 [Myxococcota bacterium]|jgi:hypothetical protein